MYQPQCGGIVQFQTSLPTEGATGDDRRHSIDEGDFNSRPCVRGDLSGWDMPYILIRDRELHNQIKEKEEKS